MLPPGKLPLALLDDLLQGRPPSDARVLVGPALGEDAAVIDFGDTCLVAKTDPITFATDEIGYYAVHVSANDIATMGAVPKWFLPALLLPAGATSEASVRAIFDAIHEAAAAIGVTICGGHTEITTGIDRPIVVGQMLGEVDREAIVRSSGLQVGDVLLLTKGLAIEATAIIARELPDRLAACGVPHDVISRAANFLHDPGISVLPEARIACSAAPVHAMHDPTEGGLATALRELAAAAQVGLVVRNDALPIADETRSVCAAVDVDLLGVISSGALLIGIAEQDADTVRDALEAADIRSAVIAHAVAPDEGLRLLRDGDDQPLPEFDRDEIARLFE